MISVHIFEKILCLKCADFFHIPKARGSTVWVLLVQRYLTLVLKISGKHRLLYSKIKVDRELAKETDINAAVANIYFPDDIISWLDVTNGYKRYSPHREQKCGMYSPNKYYRFTAILCSHRDCCFVKSQQVSSQMLHCETLMSQSFGHINVKSPC